MPGLRLVRKNGGGFSLRDISQARHNLAIFQIQIDGGWGRQCFCQISMRTVLQNPAIITKRCQVSDRLLRFKPAGDDLGLKPVWKGNNPFKCTRRLKDLRQLKVERTHKSELDRRVSQPQGDAMASLIGGPLRQADTADTVLDGG